MFMQEIGKELGGTTNMLNCGVNFGILFNELVTAFIDQPNSKRNVKDLNTFYNFVGSFGGFY